MKATVGGISIFTHPISGGKSCPCCKKESLYLSTTNEWRYYCNYCDIRFNEEGVIFGSH